MSGQKIIDGLKDAIAGNVHRVTIDGQTWERVNRKPHDPLAEDEVNHLARQIDELLRENGRLRALLKHADDVVIWEHTPARSGFQEEIEAALGIGAHGQADRNGG